MVCLKITFTDDSVCLVPERDGVNSRGQPPPEDCKTFPTLKGSHCTKQGFSVSDLVRRDCDPFRVCRNNRFKGFAEKFVTHI